MNKKGFIDLDDFEPAMIILPVVGAVIGLFTASGGFSGAFTGGSFNPGLPTKVIATLLGGLIGFIFAYVSVNR